jgi:hypothetical protein
MTANSNLTSRHTYLLRGVRVRFGGRTAVCVKWHANSTPQENRRRYPRRINQLSLETVPIMKVCLLVGERHGYWCSKERRCRDGKTPKHIVKWCVTKRFKYRRFGLCENMERCSPYRRWWIDPEKQWQRYGWLISLLYTFLAPLLNDWKIYTAHKLSGRAAKFILYGNHITLFKTSLFLE